MGEAKEAEMPTQKAAVRLATVLAAGALRNSLEAARRGRLSPALRLGYGHKTPGPTAAPRGRAWSGNCSCKCAYRRSLRSGKRKV